MQNNSYVRCKLCF